MFVLFVFVSVCGMCITHPTHHHHHNQHNPPKKTAGGKTWGAFAGEADGEGDPAGHHTRVPGAERHGGFVRVDVCGDSGDGGSEEREVCGMIRVSVFVYDLGVVR